MSPLLLQNPWYSSTMPQEEPVLCPALRTGFCFLYLLNNHKDNSHKSTTAPSVLCCARHCAGPLRYLLFCTPLAGMGPTWECRRCLLGWSRWPSSVLVLWSTAAYQQAQVPAFALLYWFNSTNSCCPSIRCLEPCWYLKSKFEKKKNQARPCLFFRSLVEHVSFHVVSVQRHLLPQNIF